MTFMQRKLQRLQQEHLDAFKGNSLGTMVEAPRMSRLERERKAAIEAVNKVPDEAEVKPAKANDWQSMSFDDAFASVKPKKSRLERDKEALIAA